jgi:hypothetical protein
MNQKRPPKGATDGENSPPLQVVTGFSDDPRKKLRPGDAMYALAHHAWRFQDDWPLEEWRSFWTTVLPGWPRRGRQSAPIESLTRTYATLYKQGVSFAKIDAVVPSWYADADALRKKPAPGQSSLRDRVRNAIAQPPLLSDASGPPRFTLRITDEHGGARDVPLPASAVFPRIFEGDLPASPAPSLDLNILGLDRTAAGARTLPELDRDEMRSRLDAA